MRMTEREFDVFMKDYCEKVKGETEASVRCTVTGGLECYAMYRFATDHEAFGYASEAALDRDITSIEAALGYRVDIKYIAKGTVEFFGAYKRVCEAIDRLGSFVVDISDPIFEEPDVY